MNIRIKGHNYDTNFTYWLRKLVFEKPYFRPTLRPYSSHNDCCDYWIPITDPRAVRALMLDDELGLGTAASSDREASDV